MIALPRHTPEREERKGCAVSITGKHKIMTSSIAKNISKEGK